MLKLSNLTANKFPLKTKSCLLYFVLCVTAPCFASVFELTDPKLAIVGQDQEIQTVYEDTLYDLARKYSLGSEELIRVNPGIDPWIPGADKTLFVPGRHILPSGPHTGIIVTLGQGALGIAWSVAWPGSPAGG